MKRFILLSLLVLVVGSAFSQDHFRLSFTGSPSVNWMMTNNNSASSKKPVLGYDFGINADLYLSQHERYALHTGLLVANTGGELSFRNTTDFLFSETILPKSSIINFHLRYIEVPLAIKLKTNQFHRTSYWGLFGVSTMLNIDAKGQTSDGLLKKSSIRDEINLMNLSMNVGLGFEYDLGGNNAISGGIIFQNGLTDVTTDNAFEDKTIVNSLKIKLGLVF